MRTYALIVVFGPLIVSGIVLFTLACAEMVERIVPRIMERRR